MKKLYYQILKFPNSVTGAYHQWFDRGGVERNPKSESLGEACHTLVMGSTVLWTSDPYSLIDKKKKEQ